MVITRARLSAKYAGKFDESDGHPESTIVDSVFDGGLNSSLNGDDDGRK
jgi:hypothetical protein